MLFLPQFPAGEYHQEGASGYAADFFPTSMVKQSCFLGPMILKMIL
jgi:hypothetical protein